MQDNNHKETRVVLSLNKSSGVKMEKNNHIVFYTSTELLVQRERDVSWWGYNNVRDFLIIETYCGLNCQLCGQAIAKKIILPAICTVLYGFMLGKL